MATTNHLPVFGCCYALLLEVAGWEPNLSREYRAGIYNDVKEHLLTALVQVYRANNATGRGKLDCIDTAWENMLRVKLMVRVLGDLQKIHPGQIANAAKYEEEIDKHLANWGRYVKSQLERGETPKAEEPTDSGGVEPDGKQLTAATTAADINIKDLFGQ